jgi:cell division transport system ATP-binding protein
MIVFRSATLEYPNGVRALVRTDLAIEKGEFVFIVGATGMGKSSLLKLIYAAEVPSSGKVYVDGRDVAALPRSAIPKLRRKMGVVFQDFKLLPQRTIWENVAFAMQVIGANGRAIRRRVPEVLDLVDLTARADSYPAQLSGGEQQRTSIARAIVNNPTILLADEPTGNLDPATSWEITKLLERINLKGTTVLVATHDSAVVDRMKRRVVAFEHGRIIRDQIRGTYRRLPPEDQQDEWRYG